MLNIKPGDKIIFRNTALYFIQFLTGEVVDVKGRFFTFIPQLGVRAFPDTNPIRRGRTGVISILHPDTDLNRLADELRIKYEEHAKASSALGEQYQADAITLAEAYHLTALDPK